MLVCHPSKFIYMKSHKTAGTTVEMYFERVCLPDRGPAKAYPLADVYTPETAAIVRRALDLVFARIDYGLAAWMHTPPEPAGNRRPT